MILTLHAAPPVRIMLDTMPASCNGIVSKALDVSRRSEDEDGRMIKRFLSTTIVLPLVFGPFGCTDESAETGTDPDEQLEELVQQLLVVQGQLTVVYKGIQDVESGKAAAGKIEELMKSIREMERKRQSIGALDPEEDSFLRKKHWPQLDAAKEAFLVEKRRLQALPEVYQVIQGVIDKVEGKGDEKAKSS